MRTLILTALLAVAAIATSTTPFKSDTWKLSHKYLLKIAEVGPGNWSIVMSSQKCDKYENNLMPCKELAAIQHNTSNNELGWDFVKVSSESYYYAGYLEGMATAKSIGYFVPVPQPSTKALAWVQAHIAYMTNKSKSEASDPFWKQVGNLLDQVRGIADGFTAMTGTTLSMQDAFLINFGDEIGDVETHVKHSNGAFARDQLLPLNPNAMHCSALIKPTHDDMFMAHDTWSDFLQMAYRQYKVYAIQGTTVTLSGYPAQIASGDDWYMTSNGLAIQETTNGVMNTSLFVHVVPHTVSEFIRVMAASYLSVDGDEWTRYFAKENSGTYNNQYMVVNWKVHTPGRRIADGTLWVAEQVPGYVERGDQSHVLREKGYWASYNVPYYHYIYDVSGYKKMEEEQGTFWSYTKYARPEIFKRNETDVKDLASMMRMMRYNNYKNDPFSIIPNCTGATDNKCSPTHSSMLSIASRGDLMKVYNTSAKMMDHYGPLSFYVAQGCFGALDSKIASYKNRHSLTGITVSGPTNDQQPTFSWNTGACTGTAAPKDSPQTFDFPWVEWRL